MQEVICGFGGLDCNVNAEQAGGPVARTSRAGFGPRAGVCPPLLNKYSTYIHSCAVFSLVYVFVYSLKDQGNV